MTDDLVRIIWNTEQERFKVAPHTFLIQSKLKPGMLVDAVPVGPLYTAVSSIEPLGDIIQRSRDHPGQPNAYELTLSASDVQPQEYTPVVNAYTYRFYRARPAPSAESSPELLDHIRSIASESRDNDYVPHDYD